MLAEPGDYSVTPCSWCGCHRHRHRIDGSVVIRRCDDCGRVEEAQTKHSPATLWAMAGFLGSSALLAYEPAGEAGERRWRELTREAA